MKQIFIISLVVLSLFSCKEEPKPEGYVINGTAKDIYNGMRIYLQKSDNQGQLKNVDSTVIMNETFKLNGSVNDAEMLILKIDGITGLYPIIIENSEISIEINKNDITKSVIEGSESHNSYLSYMKQIQDLQSALQTLYIELDKAEISKNTDNYQLIKEKIDEVTKKGQDFTPNFIESNSKNYASLFILDINLNAKNVDIERFEKAFNQLLPKIKNSDYGKQVNNKIIKVKEIQEKSKRLAIGQKAPDFTAPDPNGNPLSLYKIKGKVTIIDFWAAWCGPCRRENPNVVKVYEQFHDKGLEIIGVSLDGTPNQPDAKGTWIKAIEDDKLSWHHVSFLQYFNDPVAKMYDINAIPATFIIDEEGTIVAKNLRGIALEQKIAELLN